MDIVIIGAGISGLSTYLFLKKHVLSLPNQKHKVKIYESYDVSKYVGRTCTPCLNTESLKDIANAAASSPVHEPTFTPEAIASAIGISRNGLDVLSRLFTDEKGSADGFSQILSDMLEEGSPATSWQMSNARGWLLADISMLPKRLQGKVNRGQEKTRRSSSESTEEENMKVEDRPWVKSPINLIMISRQAFWSILLKHVVAQDGGVIQQKKVADLVIPCAVSPEKTVIRFADGSEETADLVIGADGLRSVVRKAMFRPQPPPTTDVTCPVVPDEVRGIPWLLSFLKPSRSTVEKDYVTPHYEGLVGVGSFIPASLLSSTDVPPGVMSVVFGPNGFFGYGYITSSDHPTGTEPCSSKTLAFASQKAEGVAVFWSTFGSESENPFPLPQDDHASDTNPSRRTKPYEFDKSAALKALQARHGHWSNPTIQAVLKHVQEKSGIDGFWPTWTTPELPTWSKNGRIVLVGDAAHALQPSSGQGACQALEDAEGLSLLLRHYLSVPASKSQASGLVEESYTSRKPRDDPLADRRALSSTLQSFDQLRLPRLHKIYERSQKMSGMKSDMGFVGEMMMYAAIWVMMKLGGGGQEELMGYDLPKDVERVIREREGELRREE